MRWLWFIPDRVSERTMDKTPDFLWNALDWITDKVGKITCFFVGHEPTTECGIPAHDYCFWCKKSMPGEYKGPLGKPLSTE